MNKIYKIAIIGLGQVGNYLYRELKIKKRDIYKDRPASNSSRE